MDDQADYQASTPIELTADIVAAYVSNNSVPVSELATLLSSVHAALASLGSEATGEPAGPEKPTPAQIKKSVTPNAIVSFEDGKSYKTMKRHLNLRGLTPETYRAKYGLPADYPMTSANYSAQRSALAHALGLGQQRRSGVAVAAKPTSVSETVSETVSDAPKTRGRPRKVKEEA